MEAKETVIPCKVVLGTQLEEAFNKYMLQQAEISFKAGLEQGKNLILSNNNMADILHQAKQEGIREVVEWMGKQGLRVYRISDSSRLPIPFNDDLEWQAFLRERGIDDGKEKETK